MVLFNSANPPCAQQNQLGRRFRDAGMIARLCCHTFLQQVADLVNRDLGGDFAIIVASPGNTKIYGVQGASRRIDSLAIQESFNGNDVIAALRDRRRHRRQYCESSHDLEAELIKAACDLLLFILESHLLSLVEH